MIEICSCSTMDEFEACVELQAETWGYDETEIIPRKTFLLAQKIGGQVMGAFEQSGSEEAREQQGGKTGNKGTREAGGEVCASHLVGFAMSLPAIKETDHQPFPYLHSHMLAVKAAYRNRGIGTQLKRAQRDEALGRGIRHMEWTFDPLEIKNAFLNIRRLGAVCRAYRENFYGVSSSRLQGGLPTDRLLAEWELDSPRVRACLDGHPAAGQIIEECVTVPASIEQWKASEAERARALDVQEENRRKFQKAFSRGFAVLGFTRDAEGNGVYQLGLYTR